MWATWCFHTCNDLLICATWLFLLCDMTHSSVSHDAFTCATWRIHIRDVKDSYVQHDSFICAAYGVATISRLLAIPYQHCVDVCCVLYETLCSCHEWDVSHICWYRATHQRCVDVCCVMNETLCWCHEWDTNHICWYRATHQHCVDVCCVMNETLCWCHEWDTNHICWYRATHQHCVDVCCVMNETRAIYVDTEQDYTARVSFIWIIYIYMHICMLIRSNSSPLLRW